MSERGIAVQQSIARGARSGRHGQLAELGQLARQFSLDHRGSNSNQRILTRALADSNIKSRDIRAFSSCVRISC